MKDPGKPRIEVDLRRWPAWPRTLLVLAVVAGVAAAGWIAGRDQPVPEWIPERLVPILSGLVLVLLALAFLDWLRKRL